ncbi:hypothetical protein FHS27_000167 [Rhodopirellula rubra]|uniref:Secreted protein n=1 Tax=Aporhodopirellula rubra TaxID=980271 RepID=A0A7W5DUP6_9BACT|nr:hypothetical protein [Aporhodopirellula rubra]MBB3204403.1 hypothetical protein [Aporhodopirellula rubra]
MLATRWLVIALMLTPVFLGCESSTEPTISTTTDELTQFIADNPELNVTEEDSAGLGTGPAKGEVEGK